MGLTAPAFDALRRSAAAQLSYFCTSDTLLNPKLVQQQTTQWRWRTTRWRTAKCQTTSPRASAFAWKTSPRSLISCHYGLPQVDLGRLWAEIGRFDRRSRRLPQWLRRTSDTTAFIGSCVLRGAGKQPIGAAISMISAYCCGVPLAFILSQYTSLGIKGLWLGMGVGQFVAMSLTTCCAGLIGSQRRTKPVHVSER